MEDLILFCWFLSVKVREGAEPFLGLFWWLGFISQIQQQTVGDLTEPNLNDYSVRLGSLLLFNSCHLYESQCSVTSEEVPLFHGTLLSRLWPVKYFQPSLSLRIIVRIKIKRGE